MSATQTSLSTWTLLTATAGLLAFLVGAYTLIGRERKSPYLINSVFAVFLICLLGAAFDLAAELITPWRSVFLPIGASLLLVALGVTMWRLWTIYVRLALFVDPGAKGRVKLVPGLRQFRAWRKKSDGPSYEHNPVPLSAELQEEIKTITQSVPKINSVSPAAVEIRDAEDPRSLAMALEHQGQSNELLGKLAMAFLSHDNHHVQYLTASRHPVEFISYLKKHWKGSEGTWITARARIVCVDAYTPHFGFTDTINGAKDEELRKEIGNRLLRSSETYAGLHSATSAAFKLVKRESPIPTMRQPTLVIYEDTHALSDLESVEQYRIFARHVLPSERLWGGMFTVFVETAQAEADWKMVSSYASMMLDLRAK